MRVLILICIILFCACNEASQVKKPYFDEKYTNAPPVVQYVECYQLYRDYKNNEVRADNVYRGKVFTFKGRIGAIEKDFADNPYVTIYMDSDGFSGLHCFFSNGNDLVNLNKGDIVSIKGTCYGMIMGDIIFKKCSIQ